jgi:hypothetical protein
MSPEGIYGSVNPFENRRGFWVFAIATWALAMLAGVGGVALSTEAGSGSLIVAPSS